MSFVFIDIQRLLENMSVDTERTIFDTYAGYLICVHNNQGVGTKCFNMTDKKSQLPPKREPKTTQSADDDEKESKAKEAPKSKRDAPNKDQQTKPDINDDQKQQSMPKKKVKLQKHTIDGTNDALYEYYKSMGQGDRYYEEEERGIFKAYCEDNGMNEDQLEEEFEGGYQDAGIVAIDDEFPGADSMDDAKKYIFDIIKRCWNYPEIPWAFKQILGL